MPTTKKLVLLISSRLQSNLSSIAFFFWLADEWQAHNFATSSKLKAKRSPSFSDPSSTVWLACKMRSDFYLVQISSLVWKKEGLKKTLKNAHMISILLDGSSSGQRDFMSVFLRVTFKKRIKREIVHNFSQICRKKKILDHLPKKTWCGW